MERVERNTAQDTKNRIDEETLKNIQKYSRENIDERLKELEKEWDIERILELNASSLALSGVILSMTIHKRWLILTLGVTAFLAQHAIQGWCPPLPILRKLGFRTRDEINREKMSLKALRGDFNNVKSPKEAFAASAK